jgi:hypothetical protein
MSTIVSGKAEGRCRGVEGVVGWFSAGFTGYAAAVRWRDGQTQHEPEVRDRWAILERLDPRWGVIRTWCLPPSLAEHAQQDPRWTPEVPWDLLSPATQWALIDARHPSVPPGSTPCLPRESSPITGADGPAAKPKRRGRKSPLPAAGS